MKVKIVKLYILIASIFVSSCSFASSQGIYIPDQETERLSIRNINVTGENFWAAYQSKDVAQRHLAEMYLSGVLDATEGMAWCDYSVALSGSIQEQIYIGFKKQTATALQRRASQIIVETLASKLPCRSKK
jgi:Rap1a immunity proteins